jgi:hypothetical protein
MGRRGGAPEMHYVILALVGLLGLYGVSGLVLPSNPDVPTIDDLLDDPEQDDDGSGDANV